MGISITAVAKPKRPSQCYFSKVREKVRDDWDLSGGTAASYMPFRRPPPRYIKRTFTHPPKKEKYK